MRFGRITASNIGPFAEFELDLSQGGLILILGENQDTTSANSNGSGKSTLLKAINWCLHGKSTDGDDHDRIIRKRERGCWARVEWADEAGNWAVARVKQRGKTPTLTLEHNGKDVSAIEIKQTQAAIDKRLGMDFDTWRNTVLYAQGDLVRFADPDTTDGERKSILKRILRMETLDKAGELARKSRLAIDQQMSKLERDDIAVAAELRALPNPDDLQAQLDAAEQEVAVSEAKAKKLAKLNELQVDIKEAIGEIRERWDEVRKNQAEASEHDLAAGSAKGERTAAEREVTRLTKELANFSHGQCPTCGKMIEEGDDIAAHIEDMEVKCRDAEVAVTEWGTKIEDEIKLAAHWRATAAQVQREMDDDAKTWEAKLVDLRREIVLAEQAATLAAAAKRRADQARGQLSSFQERRTALATRDDANIKAKEELTASALYADFWAKGFSNAGIQSQLMDVIIPDLTQRANHYLGILSDGDITVAFDTQSQLKSGESREKLAINWTVEGNEDVTPSGGQRKKISIAVDLALMDLVANRERAAIDLLMMDEVLDGLDATGKQRIMDLLSELRQKRSTILVISHDPAIAELFERVIIVRKEKRVSVLDTQ